MRPGQLEGKVEIFWDWFNPNSSAVILADPVEESNAISKYCP